MRIRAAAPPVTVKRRLSPMRKVWDDSASRARA